MTPEQLSKETKDIVLALHHGGYEAPYELQNGRTVIWKVDREIVGAYCTANGGPPLYTYVFTYELLVYDEFDREVFRWQG